MVALSESSLPVVPLQESAPPRVFWGCHDTPLGPILVGMSDHGLWQIEFTSGYGIGYDLGQWQKEWPDTEFIPDAKATAAVACQFSQINPWKWGVAPLAVYGTAFQMKVWKAMLQLKPGEPMSFADVAALVGKPDAVRAVGLAAETTPYAVQAQKFWESSGPEEIGQKQRRLFVAAQSLFTKR